MILKNLWYRKTRTLLTILGIAIGVAAVLAFSAFGEGLATGFERAFSSPDADLTVAQKDALAMMLSIVDADLGAELRALPGVTEVSGSTIGLANLPGMPYFVVFGEELRGLRLAHFRLIEGGPLQGTRQMLLGKLAAQALKKGIGDTVRINGFGYRIVGLYETGVGLEDGGAVITLADAQRTFDMRNKVSYYNVKVSDLQRIDAVKATIEQRWSAVSAMRSGEPTRQTEMLDLYRSFGWFLGIFAVLVGGLGMMNTTLMSVSERTREIGVLRAIGWRRGRVIAMILGESLALALIGGAVGILLGLGLTSLTRLSPAVDAMMRGVLKPGMFVQAVVTALLLGTVGGLYPAWRAARLAPIEAMRHESGAAVRTGRLTRLLARLPGSDALRSLWRRPTRTVVTITGIGLGVGFVVALMAMTEGFVVQFKGMAAAGEADLVAQQAHVSDMGLSKIAESTADRVALVSGVRSVSKIIYGVSTAPGMPWLMVFGAEPNSDYLRHYRLREGRLLARPKEAMLGRLAADGLRKEVGDRVRLGGTSYLVVGVFETGVVYEDGAAVLTLRDAQSLLGWRRQISMLNIRLVDPARATEMGRVLEAQFADIAVSTPSSFVERAQDFATLNAMTSVLVALTMVVGGVVMTNAVLMSVFERTQEIGVLRALGWRRRRVLGMVLAEAVVLSLLSSALGAVIGVGLGLLVAAEPSYGRYFLIPSYSWGLVGQVVLLAVVLGALGGLYPAWRATRLRPIEALRYE